jgi:hypothetical protein
MRKSILILNLVLLSAVPCGAQTLAPEPFTNRSIGIELIHPFLEDDDVEFLTFAATLAARLPIGSVHLLAELPFAVYNDDLTSSEGLGNVMVGVEAPAGSATLYATLHLPTASSGELANFMAFLADFHRAEAWAPDATTLSFGGIMRERGENNSGFDYQLGAAIIGSSADTEDDLELLLDYGAQYVYRPRTVGFTFGLQGRAFLTAEGDGSFADRTFHEVRTRLDYTGGRVRPAIGIAIPLDEDRRDIVNPILRLGLQFGI